MVIRKKKYQDEYCVHGLETITKTDLLLNVMKERNPIADVAKKPGETE